jgi:endonuclease/exonuclease/phosphatase family metal-dependent hydrolase
LSHANHPRARRRLGLAFVLGLICALGVTLLPGGADAKGTGNKVGHTLTAMTRNLYLGADLNPVLTAPNINAAVDGGGQIVNQVHATNFPGVRAGLLATEIKSVQPDVLGVQEGAWWRTGPVSSNPIAALTSPTASTTDPQGGDFLTDLLNQLNTGNGKSKGKAKKSAGVRYRLAASNNEFDAELPVNNGSGGLAAATHDERLTMRDAIFVQKGVKVKNVTSGHYNVLLQVKLAPPLNIPVNVTRGWVAADVKVHGRWIHVVDTHFEAFDSNASNLGSDGKTYPKGGIRQAQAQQLVAPGGPTTSKYPTVLLGDLNSDVPPHGDQVAGDTLGYQAVLNGGFTEKSPSIPPFGCCIQDPNLANPSTAGITHRVDHIMSNSKKVKFQRGGLTHLYGNGLWSSDHAGTWSRLLIK